MQVNFFLFDRSPQPLRKDVIDHTSFPIHTDLHVCISKQSTVLWTGEMAPLITIPDDRNSLC